MKRQDDHADIDALLKSDSQDRVRRVVRSLPEESLSLAWRSGLNERLREIKPVPRWRARLVVAWKPALGLALATCLAAILVFRTAPTPTHHTANVEASLVAVYEDSASSDEVSGSGLALHEVNDTTKTSDSSAESTDSDLSTL